MERSGGGEAARSIPADAGFGQSVCRYGRNVRTADHELHDTLAAATCVEELRLVALSLNLIASIAHQRTVSCLSTPKPPPTASCAFSPSRASPDRRRRSGVSSRLRSRRAE